jgi:shikimate kinase
MDPSHVVFVGAMGSGKTTIGQRVAAALGRPFVDNDDALKKATGMSAAALSKRDGIDELHRVEGAIALDAIVAGDDSVIAAAASTIDDTAVRDALRRHAWVVWLRADPDVLVERLPSPTRPFGDHDPVRLVREQSRIRDLLFAEVADTSFDTGHEPIDAVVAGVVASADRRGLGDERKEHRPSR